MRGRDPNRWIENADGSYRRKTAEEMGLVEPMNVAEADGVYADMTKAELEAALEARGLPKYGNKPELIERLQEADSAA
jgi:hypothetical protein